MPPSAGACQTTDAALNPDCGRAGERSSIMTAIGCRAAAAGLTSPPVSGAGTSVGPGVGVGRGGRLGVGVGLPDPAAPLDGVAVGDSEGGVLPSAAMLPEPFGVEPDGAPMAAVSIPK